MRHKLPWIDLTKCKPDCECKPSELCKSKAFIPPEISGESPRVWIKPARVDLEKCKQCGDCEHACIKGAVRMV